MSSPTTASYARALARESPTTNPAAPAASGPNGGADAAEAAATALRAEIQALAEARTAMTHLLDGSTTTFAGSQRETDVALTKSDFAPTVLGD